jgi:hypothetical protein
MEATAREKGLQGPRPARVIVVKKSANWVIFVSFLQVVGEWESEGEETVLEGRKSCNNTCQGMITRSSHHPPDVRVVKVFGFAKDILIKIAIEEMIKDRGSVFKEGTDESAINGQHDPLRPGLGYISHEGEVAASFS